MISIIIPAYNEEGYIAETLQYLKENLTDIDHEIIVSDSRSTDRTAELAEPLCTTFVEMPLGKKRGISQGKNDGAKMASGEFFVFIDADVTIPHPNEFFKKLLAEFEKKPSLGAITVPIWVSPELATTADKIGFGILNFFYLVFNNVLHAGTASGEFQMIRSDIFKKVGGYREDFAAGEDNEMFRAIGKITETEVFWKESVFHSGRRIHKVGWAKTAGAWLKNGIYVAIFRRSPYKEWDVVR